MQRAKDAWDFVIFLLTRFVEDKALNSAAALTYTTLFAVVPIMTVTFTMLAAVPAFQGAGEQIQNFVFQNFVPSAGSVVQEHLKGFAAQARNLTWVGVAVLAFTAFMMLVTIEKAFNAIWRVQQPRRGVSSFLLYWAILSLGPLLLGAGFALSTYVTSLSIMSDAEALPGVATLLRFVPFVLSVGAFTLLYSAVPNARVKLGRAVAGALVTALLFEAAKAAFGLYVKMFPSFQLIYGAFAAFPVFLLWIYLSWVIVLFGAELVCHLSSSGAWRRLSLPPLLVMMGVLRVFHDAQQAGKTVRLKHAQKAGWPLPEADWADMLALLQSLDLVCRTSDGDWVLSRDLDRLSLYELVIACPWPLPTTEQLPEKLSQEAVWYPALRSALCTLQQEREARLSPSVASWLEAETVAS